MKACHRCQNHWREPGQPGFNNTCEKCGMSLHACANCKHFVPRGNLRCLVPGTERVLDFQAANRCSSFEFLDAGMVQANHLEVAAEPPAARGASAKDRFNNLFK